MSAMGIIGIISVSVFGAIILWAMIYVTVDEMRKRKTKETKKIIDYTMDQIAGMYSSLIQGIMETCVTEVPKMTKQMMKEMESLEGEG